MDSLACIQFTLGKDSLNYYRDAPGMLSTTVSDFMLLPAAKAVRSFLYLFSKLSCSFVKNIIKLSPVDNFRHFFYFLPCLLTSFSHTLVLWINETWIKAVLVDNYLNPLRRLLLFVIIVVFSLLINQCGQFRCPQVVDKMWTGYSTPL